MECIHDQHSSQRHKIKMPELIRRLLYRIRRKYLLLRHPNLRMGYGTVVIGNFHLRGNGMIIFGDECRLENVKLMIAGQLDIGRKVFLNGTSIVCKQLVTINDECLVSDAYITDTDFHNIEPELRRAPPGPRATRPIKIGRNVWIGDRGVVLKGSTIGNDSVIGSNSVVRGNVPDRVVCIGNPAMVVKNFDLPKPYISNS